VFNKHCKESYYMWNSLNMSLHYNNATPCKVKWIFWWFFQVTNEKNIENTLSKHSSKITMWLLLTCLHPPKKIYWYMFSLISCYRATLYRLFIKIHGCHRTTTIITIHYMKFIHMYGNHPSLYFFILVGWNSSINQS
jgi:hypothetical protein